MEIADIPFKPGLPGTKILNFIGFKEVLTMKKRFLAYAAAAFVALGCSSTSQLRTQVYDDGVYSRPSTVTATQVAVTDSELDNLLVDSKNSQAYIINSQGDTLVVPEGKRVLFNTDTELTVVDSPVWLYDYSWAYRPWYLWDYYHPWRSSWYYNSWYYTSLYYFGSLVL